MRSSVTSLGMSSEVVIEHDGGNRVPELFLFHEEKLGQYVRTPSVSNFVCGPKYIYRNVFYE